MASALVVERAFIVFAVCAMNLQSFDSTVTIQAHTNSPSLSGISGIVLLCIDRRAFWLRFCFVHCNQQRQPQQPTYVADFVKNDVQRLYRDLLPYVKITVVEAGPSLLGPFDKALQDYALGLFGHRDIDVRLGTAVLGVEDYTGDGYHFPAKRAVLSDGQSLEFGTMVWSAGLAPTEFVQNLDQRNNNNDDKNKDKDKKDDTETTKSPSIPRHPRTNRILVDDYLRVKGHEGSIWAIGDAAVNETGVPLPQLAQVARQEGIYLAKVLNGTQGEDAKPFEFFSLGSMAFMGDLKGVYDGSSVGTLKDPAAEPKETGSTTTPPPALKGFMALLLWRFAYWGRQTSIVNKILIPMYWFKAFVFGRDISRY